MIASNDPRARTPEEWREAMGDFGEAPYRGDQIFQWIQKKGVLDPAAMTNLSKTLRDKLSEELGDAARVVREHRSEDDTRKLLVELADGNQVETVLLPSGHKLDADAATADDDDGPRHPGTTRVTQCISTQVGCAMGCVFCASGIAGLKRHMTASEIVGQIQLASRQLEPNERLSHVVFMGMGEPLHNYEATARAITLLTHEKGLGMSPRRLTISTSGLVPEIERLGADFDGQVGLAISLHNANDERRSALMPINDRYPLRELMGALRRYPLRRGRRITIEYTLVSGQNDSLDDARGVARLLARLPVKINLIPMNPIEHSDLGPPDTKRVLAFQQVLRDADFHCFVRRRRGDDVSAACGQLVMLGHEPNKQFLRRQPRGEPEE
jgi:23S rRNA (adenine2503-C2)-methyltransferase